MFFELDEHSKRIAQPKKFKIKLKPHQLTSVAAMLDLEKDGIIMIANPAVESGLCKTIRYRIRDNTEMINSTYQLETNCAILADKVGSGKTYMILALIATRGVPPVHNRFVLGTDHFSIKMISCKEPCNVNLIAVPHNLVNQWGEFVGKTNLKYISLNTIHDFDVFFDKSYVTTMGPVVLNKLTIYKKCRQKKMVTVKTGRKVNKEYKTVYEKLTLNNQKVNNILETYDVLLLNLNRYKLFKQVFGNVKWARVIIDEMDSANVPLSFDEFGNFNWFVTATPTAIFYKSCRRYIGKIFGRERALLDYFIVKNKDEYVDQSVVLPTPYVYIINALLGQQFAAIKDLIPEDVMQLINAGNTREAITKLNCGIETEENITEVLGKQLKKELYNYTKELEYNEALIPDDPEAHANKIKRIKEEIAKCNTRLETIKERVESIKTECCIICTEKFRTPVIMNCCKMVFCLACVMEALKKSNNKCPFCRYVVKSNKEFYVVGKQSVKTPVKNKFNKNAIEFSSVDKMIALECILKGIVEIEGDTPPRILIFSDYPQTFNKIINNIAKVNLTYSLISGVPAHITKVIDEFNRGVTNILLLDSQHYGSGLNLQAAKYLILFHRMKPELETQVIGRAHRFGRTDPLRIIYITYQSESTNIAITKKKYFLKNTDELWMLIEPIDDEADAEADTEDTPVRNITEEEEEEEEDDTDEYDVEEAPLDDEEEIVQHNPENMINL